MPRIPGEPAPPHGPPPPEGTPDRFEQKRDALHERIKELKQLTTLAPDKELQEILADLFNRVQIAKDDEVGRQGFVDAEEELDTIDRIIDSWGIDPGEEDFP